MGSFNFSEHKRGWLIVATLLIAGTLLFIAIGSSDQASSSESHSASNAATAGVTASSAADNRGSVQNLWHGLPADLTSTDERFDFLKDCSSYRRFKALFESEKQNPDYPLNNALTMASLSPIEQEMLRERVELVEKGGSRCDAWVSQVPLDLSQWQFYYATLEAAKSGNSEAANCFVMSHWNPPEQYTAEYELEPKFETLATTYVDYARSFVDREIEKGNWVMVHAAYNAARASHGLNSRLPNTQADGYIWSRLLQLGAYDTDRADGFGYSAAEFASGLTSVELNMADAAAKDLFSRVFGSRKMKESELYENCGN